MVRSVHAPSSSARNMTIRRAVRCALAGVALMAAVPQVLAGPDPCTTTPTVRTCSGNQSSGIVITSLPAELDVVSLTSDITRAGFIAVQFSLNGGAGDSGGYSPVGAGGDGDAGGTGGAPTLNLATGAYAIRTSGDADYGAYVSANGGGGGGGGAATGFPIPPLFVITGPAFGGDGGRGGDGGDVTANLAGSIFTTGVDAYGIYAESRAGRGGNGGWAFSTTYAEGGDGGGGGDAGDILVDNSAGISTLGVGAYGIYGSALGGEGGGGGEGDGLFGSGGTGLGSGNGGGVAIVNHGGITTASADASGIFAQSVGGFAGGGGTGGGIWSWGGSGNSAGDGGVIDVTNSGAVSTTGRFAFAIHGQSIGGGGGNGGSAGGIWTFGGSGEAGGDGGTVTIHNVGALSTHGADASGIFGQSVGGGGGSGGDAGAVGATFTVALGGTGGPGGDGSAVVVESQAGGTITTAGDRASGIFAQSIGGGGGDGGYAVSLAAGEIVSIGVAIGGDGNLGGDGNSVRVNNAGDIGTQGAEAHGIRAESIGGGGGAGGGSVSAAASDGFSATFTYGGRAAGGGIGRDVTVNNSGEIATDGGRAAGIAAHSIGGGGGSGGWTITGSGGGVGALNIGIGGDGGLGGDGGTVAVTNSGVISTLGEKGYGIDARSIGGGGGDGGWNISGAGAGGAAGTFTLGGRAEGGGSANTVAVQALRGSSIHTTGIKASGIVAESTGGGGGDGGWNISGAGAGAGALVVTIGGSGGNGGDGKAVTVANDGSILTEGAGAYGIRARSLGGGGGDGGFTISGAGAGTAAGTFSLGGKGGSGGNGDEVTVSGGGAIETLGDKSAGILAASIGGGGGDGGWNIAGSGAGTGALSVTIGGSGGSGGYASAVVVNTSSSINTSGAQSQGIRARSLGGGGGDGGFNLSGAGAGTGAMTFSLGGSGDFGGAGDTVNVTSAGSILTHGASAEGILAESLGGGGGNGGFSITGAGAGWGALTVGIGGKGKGGGASDEVRVTSLGSITTSGTGSFGIRARSIGGGGGDGGFSIAGSGAGTYGGTFSLGGSGDLGGKSGDVAVHSDGAIETSGARAGGILAESIGGGGGDGGFSITGTGSGTAALAVGIGGSGKGGGNGAGVTVDSIGSIHTSGDQSHAIRARSLGGGGGDGGFSITGAGAGQFGATFNLGGSGGGGGDAGAVNVMSLGVLHTEGAGAAGVLAESLGGGGGDGGFSITGAGGGWGGFSIGIGGFGAGGGNAEQVTVVNEGGISTLGAKSYGIRARSIGGGGGDGAFSISGAGGGDYGGTFNLGGYGDKGGRGANVTVTNAGTIDTQGEKAAGILAESIGGGGGEGGFSITGSGAGTGALSVGIGGGGDAGGDAGVVTVTNTGDIRTLGAKAHGIRARSLGGGGGDGGFSITGSGAGDYSGTFSLGGASDKGGNAGDVSVYNDGSIVVAGKQADGILAASIGGGGGDGGWSVNGSGAGTGSLNVGIGGLAGDGGHAGVVHVENTRSVVSTAEQGRGIVATSTGGGGGDGGFSFVGSFSYEGGKDLGISVGGHGGDGSYGGDVAVINTGLVDVSATGSHGIVASSKGGGGGSGGASYSVGTGFGGAKDSWNVNVNAAVGGHGGDGSYGGAVQVVNEGDVVTRNDDAIGIYATSIGGGGGDGGSSFTATLALAAGSEGHSINGNLSVGGWGGDGSTGGTVTVDNGGDVRTYGDRADAIKAQSIGGGGGNGGKAKGISLLMTTGGAKLDPKKGQIAGSNWIFGANVGGNGGEGNDGGLVTVTNSGDIATEGVLARGIVAQSIGAGGGGGGDAVNGTETALDYVTLANNMGGSGVLGKLLGQLRTWQFTVGGSEGASGNAEDVVVVNAGSIYTKGMGSTGIFVQSIGGGGGESQNYVKTTTSGGTAVAGAMGKVGIGGAGGAGGNGGDIDITHSGDIVTLGNEAYGIYAQSIGGGGGKAGNVDRVFANNNDVPSLLKNIGIGLSFGRDGGGGGDGGIVSIDSTGNIETWGDDAAGISAQSIGGGGGDVGALPNEQIPGLSALSFKGSVGAAGSGGDVTVNHAGNIVTRGIGADGIFAQSAGGQGSGAAVTVTLSGSVSALGEGSSGIVAQSIGLGGNSDIDVTVGGGIVRGGTGDAAGVYLHDGKDNVITNQGTIGSVAGLAGNAILGTGGNDAVVNFGIVAGNLGLGAGTNRFDNLAGASLLAGARLDLGGDANLLTNHGTLSSGGAGLVYDTAVTGSYVQSSGGTLLVDLDVQRGLADHLAVSGVSTLGGAVDLKVLNAGRAVPGTVQFGLVSGAGGMTDAGIALADGGTAVANYRLLWQGETQLDLQSTIDFAPDGLARNERAIGMHVNDIQAAGGTAAFEPLAEQLFWVPDVPTLGAVYDSLSPETYAHTQATTVLTSLEFGDAMLSCRSRDGQYRFTREGQCGWMRLGYRETSRDQDNSGLGFDENAVNLAFGMQGAVSDHWHLGFGMAFEDMSLDTGHNASTDGTRALAGVLLKGQFAADTFALGLSGGHGQYDTTRRVAMPDTTFKAQAEYGQFVYAGGLRWAHVFEGHNWYLQPSIDLDATHVQFDAFQEHGADGANLQVHGGSDTFTSISPRLEAGGEIAFASGTLLRPFLSVGVTSFIDDFAPEVAARFAGAPGDVEPFTVTVPIDDTLWDVAAGIDLLGTRGFVLRLGYVGQFSGNLDGQAVVLKVSKVLQR